MPSVISCPSCQKQLKVPDELIGKSVKCPGCKETFTAEVMGASSAPRQEIAEKPRKQAAPPPEEEEEDEPRKKPARREDDDDDGDERPSKRIRRRSGRQLAPHRGVLIMILGIGSLVGSLITGLPFWILGPVAWWLGTVDLKEMDEGRMDPEGRSNTQIGKICGMICTILTIIGFVVTCLVLILIFGVFGMAASKVR